MFELVEKEYAANFQIFVFVATGFLAFTIFLTFHHMVLAKQNLFASKVVDQQKRDISDEGFFAKIVKNWKPLTIFVKTFHHRCSVGF